MCYVMPLSLYPVKRLSGQKKKRGFSAIVLLLWRWRSQIVLIIEVGKCSQRGIPE
jgi:hypothetical protein